MLHLPFSNPYLVNLTWSFIAALVVLFLARRALGKNGRRLRTKYVVPPLVLIALAVTVYSSLMTVEAGSVMIVTTFGDINTKVYPAGFHVVSPFAQRFPMNGRRQIFELKGGTDDVPIDPKAAHSDDSVQSIALTLDHTPLSIDVGFPFQLNSTLAWKVYQQIGLNYLNDLLSPAARSALRDAVATFSWSDAVTDRREDLATAIHTNFIRIVTNDLSRVGFTQDEAKAAFELLPVQIRRIMPPKRILTAVSENLAAAVDLQRQSVLTEIATKEAERRANEGLGVHRLFDQLPPGFSAAQIRDVLYALADKERADALMRAVGNDQVKVIVMPGGGNGLQSSPSISIPAP